MPILQNCSFFSQCLMQVEGSRSVDTSLQIHQQNLCSWSHFQVRSLDTWGSYFKKCSKHLKNILHFLTGTSHKNEQCIWPGVSLRNSVSCSKVIVIVMLLKIGFLLVAVIWIGLMILAIKNLTIKFHCNVETSTKRKKVAWSLASPTGWTIILFGGRSSHFCVYYQ